LQGALRAAFAAELDAAEAVATPTPAPPASEADVRSAPGPEARVLRFPDWLAPLLAAACVVLVAGAVMFPTVGKVRDSARRSVAQSNLRQIGQAALIYAGDHQDRLPEAVDVWDFARLLAIGGGLNDATIWTIHGDPAAKDDRDVSTVLGPDRLSLHPEFASAKPGYAVVIKGLTGASPSTTPLAWTRGLLTDGTWSPDSPYGTEGGHVVFLGGNVTYFRGGHVEFVGRDGRPTRSFRDALPEGAEVSEYVPHGAERQAWVEAPREPPEPRGSAERRESGPRAWLFAAALLAPVVALSYQIVCRRLRFGPLVLSVLLAIVLVLIGLGTG
jgi:type II secretory pathway pseudopilin PulG